MFADKQQTTCNYVFCLWQELVNERTGVVIYDVHACIYMIILLFIGKIKQQDVVDNNDLYLA